MNYYKVFDPYPRKQVLYNIRIHIQSIVNFEIFLATLHPRQSLGRWVGWSVSGLWFRSFETCERVLGQLLSLSDMPKAPNLNFFSVEKNIFELDDRSRILNS